jgi:hypothetical protein
VNTFRDAAVIALAGAAGVVFFGRPVLRAWRARSWPAVTGKVTRSRVEALEPGTSGIRRMRYALHVEYAYPAGGGTRAGNRLGFFAEQCLYREHADAAAAASKHPVGGPITVRVDPSDHAESVVSAAVPWQRGASLALAAVFLTGGLWGLLRLVL